jgi:hypothetical protein
LAADVCEPHRRGTFLGPSVAPPRRVVHFVPSDWREEASYLTTADSARFETRNNLIINSLGLRSARGIRSSDDTTAGCRWREGCASRKATLGLKGAGGCR